MSATCTVKTVNIIIALIGSERYSTAQSPLNDVVRKAASYCQS